MKLLRRPGSTSHIFQIFIRDSSSTTGAGLTGLTSASAGLTAYYHRNTDTTATAISLVTMTVGTFTSGGFKEIDATNMPGWYQFCPPDASLASGATSCGFHLKGATNMAPLPIEVDMDGQVDVYLWNGTAVPAPATAGIPDVNAKNINNVATTSVTTINANVGTTQPQNFTGTGASALVQVDTRDFGGTAGTFTSGKPAVTLASTDVTGNVASDVQTIKTQTVTCSAGVTVNPSVGFAGAPGAANGGLIAGTNAATTINGLTLTGAAASGATPAAAGLTVTGGAASTTGGGVAAAGIVATGGAGAATTNGAAAGATFVAGGTTTVSGNDGVTMTGTSNGNGLTLAHAGTGKDLNAQTTNALQVNATAINSVSTSSVTTVNANVGTTQPTNFTGTGASALVKSDMVDIAGAAVSTSTAQIGVNVIQAAGTTWRNSDGTLASATASTVTFPTTDSAGNSIPDDNRFAFCVLEIVAGTGIGQTPVLTTKSGVRTFNILSGTCPVTLDATSQYVVVTNNSQIEVIRTGTAQAGGASTITLDAGASATNNFYQNQVVFILSGTGAGQSALITTYVGTTKVATINGTWATNPDSTSVFALLPFGAISASVAGNVTVGGYAAGQDPGTYVLATPSQKLVTNASGFVTFSNTTIATATNLTNLPSIPSNWLTAAGIAAGALNGKGDWLLASSAPTNFGSLAITVGGAVTAGTVSDKTGYSLTQAFPANFASLAISVGGAVTAGTVSDKTGYALSSAGLDSVTVESGLNARQALSIIASASAGVLAGAATTTVTIAGAGVAATNRITATVDSNGNRSAVALNPPA